MKSIERRLAAVEQRLMPSRVGPLVMIFEGGLGCEPTFATAGNLRWERAPDESLGDFKARAVARSAEVCDLRWDQVEFDAAVLHVRRVKNGTPSTHPVIGDEMRALRRLHRESEPSPFVFVSERGSPFTTAGFARMIERAATSAGLGLKAHPHMLRHACGYALANKGHDTRAIQAWLGHRCTRGKTRGR